MHSRQLQGAAAGSQQAQLPAMTKQRLHISLHSWHTSYITRPQRNPLQVICST
jgi:hypothetical protein